MVSCTKNLYEILGISKNAGQNEIKTAYKRLVRIYHPDINKSENSETQFKLLNNAYSILSDENKRKCYDSLFCASNPERPDKNSIIKIVKITPNEQKTGAVRIVNILNTQKCPNCMGKKVINGLICKFCLGEGEKKDLKKIEVKLRKNIEENELVYVGKVNGSALYDKKLFLKVKIEPECKVYKEGGNSFIYLYFPHYDLVLGTKREINIENAGIFKIEIPPLTKPGTKIKLGDYFAVIGEKFPENLSEKEKKLYIKLKKAGHKTF